MKRSGFILILSLLLTSIIVALVSSIVFKAVMISDFSRVFVDRDHARSSARSGIEIALSQLNTLEVQEDEKMESDQKSEADSGKKEDPRKEYFARLFSIINRWQRFELEESVFGVSGTLDIYIACEDGKINIAQLYDEKKDDFISGSVDGKKIVTMIFDQLGSSLKKEKLLASFEQFMQKRAYPLQEVTELLTMKELHVFKDQLVPECGQNEVNSSDKKKKNEIYFFDLFTLETTAPVINPVLLSQSVCDLFGFERQNTKDGKKWVKDLPRGAVNWQNSWDSFLSPLYKKKFDTVPQGMASWLATSIDPQIFSIAICAKVGKINQKMYAIVHKDAISKHFVIRKIYWL